MNATPVTRAYEATVDDVRPEERSVVAKVGTGALDRYQTVISPHGIDLTAYRNNPIVLWEHGKGPRGTLPVGRNQWIKVDRSGHGQLIAKTVFRSDDYSQQIFEAYQDGGLRGWSINILPREQGPPTHEEIRSRPELADGCVTIYRSSELAEYSCVACPGNRETLTIMASRGIYIPDEARAATPAEAKPEPEIDEAVAALLADIERFKTTKSRTFDVLHLELMGIIRAWRDETAADLKSLQDLWKHGRV